VITAAGTTRTPEDTALSQALAAARPGQQVIPTITRSAQQLSVQVTLGELPGS
jgi:S1-C subfamily serine protease